MAQWTGFDVVEYDKQLATTALLNAQARQANANADEGEQNARAKKASIDAALRLAENLDAIPDLEERMVKDPEKALAEVVAARTAAGDLEGAEKTLTTLQATRNAIAEEKKSSFELAQKQAPVVAAAMQAVLKNPTQGGWNAAMMSLYTNYPGLDQEGLNNLQKLVELDPDDDFTYEMAARLALATTTTEAQRAEREYKEALAENQRAAASEHQARIDLLEEQTRLTEARRVALGKLGGSSKTPTTTDALRMIQNDYEGEPEELNLSALEVADEAERLVKEEHLTRATALKRAYKDLKAKGRFDLLESKTFMEGTFRNPIKMTEDFEEEDLVEGQFYSPEAGPLAGYTWKWDGENYIRVDEEEEE